MFLPLSHSIFGLTVLLVFSGSVFASAMPADNVRLSTKPIAPATGVPRRLTLDDFLAAVFASNLDLAAQRFGVPIAQAQLAAARVSPNPVINLGFTHDLSREQQAQVLAGGLTQEIEVASRRRFRVSIAQANLLAASATLDDYFRTLRGAASATYIDAVAGRLIVEQKQRAAAVLNQLADTNDFRFKAGDIAEVDKNQARLDAVSAQGDLFTSQATARTSTFALLQYLGQPGAQPPETVGRLELPDRPFDIGSLVTRARTGRPDIIAARHALESARASIQLARANRVPDPTLGITVQQASRIRNPIDPAPNFNSVVTSLSFPLPLFNSYRGELRAAGQTAIQAEKTLQSLELKAEMDVRSACARLETARHRVAQYEGQTLELADKVLASKLDAYKAGSAALLDVLAARRADTDVRLALVDALAERARAFVDLEQAADLQTPGVKKLARPK